MFNSQINLLVSTLRLLRSHDPVLFLRSVVPGLTCIHVWKKACSLGFGTCCHANRMISSVKIYPSLSVKSSRGTSSETFCRFHTGCQFSHVDAWVRVVYVAVLFHSCLCLFGHSGLPHFLHPLATCCTKSMLGPLKQTEWTDDRLRQCVYMCICHRAKTGLKCGVWRKLPILRRGIFSYVDAYRVLLYILFLCLRWVHTQMSCLCVCTMMWDQCSLS